MDENENSIMPVVLDLSAVSQLPEATKNDISAETLFYAATPAGDPDYESRKVKYSELESRLSAGMEIADFKLSVGMLSDAMLASGGWMRCDIDEPYVISAIRENHGVIEDVQGYRLSAAVEKVMETHLEFVSDTENAEPIGYIKFGETSCGLSAHSLEPIVKMRIWPGAWKI